MISEEAITFSKLEIAEKQLDQALLLLFDHNDYICAVTLAGASEEILGKLLEENGEKHALNELIETCVAVSKQGFGEEWNEKDIVKRANHFRNGFKHYTDGNPITVNREATRDIIDRAICNYFALTGMESKLMERFKNVMLEE